MERARLRQLVIEFSKLAMEAVPVQYSDENKPEKLTLEEMLKVWSDAPECLLSPMFLGYCMGEGEDINAFSQESLTLAVISAALGESSDVDFDWIGECDAQNKPH